MGKFTTDYLVKNGYRIPIVGELSINGSVQLLGIPDFVRNSELSFFQNLQAPTVTSGWGDADTSNKKLGVIPGGPYRNIAAAWVSTVTTHMDDMPRILENLRTAAGHVRDDFRRQRRRDLMRRRSTSCKPIVNPWIHCCGDDWEGPVTS